MSVAFEALVAKENVVLKTLKVFNGSGDIITKFDDVSFRIGRKTGTLYIDSACGCRVCTFKKGVYGSIKGVEYASKEDDVVDVQIILRDVKVKEEMQKDGTYIFKILLADGNEMVLDDTNFSKLTISASV